MTHFRICNDFDPSYQLMEQINKLKNLYLELDSAIQDALDDEHLNPFDSESQRTLAIARTHLETSCMYAVKSVALAGEIK